MMKFFAEARKFCICKGILKFIELPLSVKIEDSETPGITNILMYTVTLRKTTVAHLTDLLIMKGYFRSVSH